ncbi:MAG: hypothetical protein JXQ67_02505 [Campylobacterales bacterium]|nr:hypothetical protein [Campylobacterales bacterium]
MSKINMNVQLNLLKEAGVYFREMQVANRIIPDAKKEGILLTQEHIEEWLEVFYEDRIMMDTCNQSHVRR